MWYWLLCWHIDWLAYIELLLWLWYKLTWLPCMNFLMYCWSWLLIFLGGFMLYMHFVNIVSHVYKQFRNMASPTRWTWVWASLWNWWWTGKSGVLQSMGHKELDTTEQLNGTYIFTFSTWYKKWCWKHIKVLFSNLYFNIFESDLDSHWMFII